MSQKPLLAFVVGLILVSSGCLGFGDEELEQQENDNNEKQEPVGETNMTSLEKRIEHLESTIAEYEQPKVYFQEFGGDDVHTYNDNANLADDGNLFCSYNEYYNENSCLLVGITYDINGIITSFSWESSKGGQIVARSIYANSDSSISYAFNTVPNLNVCDTDVIDPSHGDQIITLTVYDNDGNSASASYAFVDYDSVCTVEEPDNEGGTDFCDDGEEKIEGGMIWSCIEGEWEAMASIVCGSNEFVSNHTCVPCPEGTTNEAGDPAPHSDTTCDENEPPIIWSFTFVPGTITNETSQFGTNIDAEDPENDSLSVSAVLLLNGQEVYSVYSEYWVSFILDISEYDIVVGAELSVIVTVTDSLGQSTTATHTVVVEESE